jgi:hypothetical protein
LGIVIYNIFKEIDDNDLKVSIDSEDFKNNDDNFEENIPIEKNLETIEN